MVPLITMQEDNGLGRLQEAARKEASSILFQYETDMKKLDESLLEKTAALQEQNAKISKLKEEFQTQKKLISEIMTQLAKDKSLLEEKKKELLSKKQKFERETDAFISGFVEIPSSESSGESPSLIKPAQIPLELWNLLPTSIQAIFGSRYV